MIPAPSLIVIGGSAGSLQVVLKLMNVGKAASQIPQLIVLHREVQENSKLAELLQHRSGRDTKDIEDKDAIERGWVYICPADYHVLIEKDHTFSLDYSEKENFSRPSIDVAFRAAAEVYKSKLMCILLSGANADGADGLRYAKDCGAITVIQDPLDAMVSYMPEQAILLQEADYVLSGDKIRELLMSLA